MGEQLLTGLTSYNLNRNFNLGRKGQVDTSEKIGTFLYTPLRIIAGREYKVIKNRRSFKEQDPSSLITRVITCMVSILLSPILLCTTLVGYGLLKYSTSYQACLTKHQQVIDRAAQKALAAKEPVKADPVKKDNIPEKELLNLDAVEEKARKSYYAGEEWFKLENLEIFKQTKEASLEEIPAIMKGALASDYSVNVIAVIVAILKQFQEGDQKTYLNNLNKLNIAMKAVSDDQLNKAIRDQFSVKDDEPKIQLKLLEEQQLDLILQYRELLTLSPAIVTKMEETLTYIAKLKEDTKDEPDFIV